MSQIVTQDDLYKILKGYEEKFTRLESAARRGVPSGSIFNLGGGAVPDGYMLADGTSKLRATYPDLFEALNRRIGDVTSITTAAPAVITLTAHGLVVGDRVFFTTTGALPTGLAANTMYYVATVPTADTFTVSATSVGAAIATTAAGNGVHTVRKSPWGIASATTFNMPLMGGSKRILANVAGVANYQFPNLNGDVDRQYKLGLSGVVTTNGADRTISIVPNGVTAGWFDNKWHQTWWDTNMQTTQGEYRGAAFGWFFGTVSTWGNFYGAAHMTCEAQVEARRISGSVRTGRANWSCSPDALVQRHVIGYGGGKWEDQATNITSLVVNFNGGTFTGDIWLEKMFDSTNIVVKV